MRAFIRTSMVTLGFSAVVTAAGSAAAQETGEGQKGMALPGAQAVAGESDHDRMVGSLAVGYLGRRGMLVGAGTTANLQAEVDAPVIGVRYWVSDLVGIDVGLGFGFIAEGGEQGGQDVDGPQELAFMLHGGVPLSLASTGHFSFQLVPELNVGFASWSQDQVTGDVFKGSGFHVDVGARVGGEIHFGFMGVPNLSLQASVGFLLAADMTSWEDEATAGSDVEATRFTLGTTVQDNPWNIFTSNVAALYYF